MEITENMTAEQVMAYREWSGCSLFDIRKAQTKLRLLREVSEAKTVSDLKTVLESIIYRLYS